MTASALYAGRVVHQRHRPKSHRLSYRVFSLLLDLGELPHLDKSLRLFGHNRRALFSLLDRDHGTGDGRDLQQHVRGHLTDNGINDADCPIRLL